MGLPQEYASEPGYGRGYTKGREDGYKLGLADGRAQTYKSGCRDGRKLGFIEGMEASQSGAVTSEVDNDICTTP